MPNKKIYIVCYCVKRNDGKAKGEMKGGGGGVNKGRKDRYFSRYIQSKTFQLTVCSTLRNWKPCLGYDINGK